MNYKNGMKSMVLGILQQIMTLIIGLIAPRLFLVTFGSETNGVLNTISNIFSYLALVEAGVGTAALQVFYETIGTNNREATNGVISAVHVYFKRAGLIYFIGVILLAVIYPLSIHTSLSYRTIFLLVILSGMGGVINFWFQGKYKLYLQAEGKNYIISAITMTVYFATNICKIAMIMMGYDVVSIYVVYFAINIGQMLFVEWYIRRFYPWLNVHVQPNLGAIDQRMAVLVQQITWIICSNTDILVLTYVGKDLKLVSVYAVYLMIYSMIENLFKNIFGSFHYLLGQKYNISKEQYMPFHEAYECMSMAVSFGLYTTTFFLMTPFLRLYTKGITDVQYVDPYLPLLFTVMHLLSSGREASSRVINFAQHFKEMQWRAILESLINIVVSVILVKKLGIYGVLLGTIIAYLYRTNDIIIYASKYILKRSCWITYKRWSVNFLIFAVAIVIDHIVNFDSSSFLVLILKAVPVCGLTCGAYLGAACLYDRKAAATCYLLISQNILKRKNRRCSGFETGK